MSMCSGLQMHSMLSNTCRCTLGLLLGLGLQPQPYQTTNMNLHALGPCSLTSNKHLVLGQDWWQAMQAFRNWLQPKALQSSATSFCLFWLLCWFWGGLQQARLTLHPKVFFCFLQLPCSPSSEESHPIYPNPSWSLLLCICMCLISGCYGLLLLLLLFLVSEPILQRGFLFCPAGPQEEGLAMPPQGAFESCCCFLVSEPMPSKRPCSCCHDAHAADAADAAVARK